MLFYRRLLMKFVLFLVLSVFNVEANVYRSFVGQLGNQLFQASAAYALARRNNVQVILPDLDQIPMRSEHKIPENYKYILHRMPRKKPPYSGPKLTVQVKEWGSYGYKAPYIEDMQIGGYLQRECYFEDYRDEIKQMFACPIEINQWLESNYPELLNNQLVVGVHVRTYLKDFGGETLEIYKPNLAFYSEAFKYFDKDCAFVVFSDKPAVAKKMFQGMKGKFVFIDTGHHIFDFYLLSKCSHQIFQDSTFGWWAAYLNTNVDKRVVCLDCDTRCGKNSLNFEKPRSENWIAIKHSSL
jgi:hypothetical protein